MDLEKELNFAKNVAIKAGNLILENFNSNNSFERKEDYTEVTQTDININKFIIEEIDKHFPTHSILGEEENLIKNSEFSWICDPIDGTKPFICGIPTSVFSLALVNNGTPLLGVVYNPFTKQLFYANKGHGAFINNSRIFVNQNNLDPYNILGFDYWSKSDFKILKEIANLIEKTGVYNLTIGSTINSGCLVANGKYVANIFVGSKGKFVDIAPLKIIVEEAGGQVTDLYGKDQRYDQDIRGAIVSNKIVHNQIVEALSYALE